MVGGGTVQQSNSAISDSQQIFNYQDLTGGLNSAHLSTTNGSSSLNGVRLDQLCDILSREIGRVRDESVQQAQDMRLQYEVELQALRNEFYHKKPADEISKVRETNVETDEPI